MTDATVDQYIETRIPSIEAVRLTVTDSNTYMSRKFHVVTGAILTLNEDTDADCNVTNSDNTVIDGTKKTVRINIAGGTTQTCTLLLFGFK